jgi:hypothetical protein
MSAFCACVEESAPIKKGLGKTIIKDTLAVEESRQPVAAFQYHFISLHNKDKAIRDSALATLNRLTPAERNIVLRLNRVDAASYRRLDTMVIPDKIDTNWTAYLVFPAELPAIKDVRKMVFFAYYPQVFAAYENGRLVRWGPTNMGKKASPTPTGLFSCNWKAVETVSTVDDEWVLKWNFNVWNKGGVGWHQYQLPGYPASHSCMRLLEEDAKWMYTWADQWLLKDGLLAAQGTPVLIFGHYPFGQHKPWWSLVENPSALNISADTLTTLVQPHIDKIITRQKQRDSVLLKMPKPLAKDTGKLAKA